MQYQIFHSKTGELVAWIDTESDDAVLKRGYEVQKGENLTVQEVIENSHKISPRTVAEFEKVTWGQYCFIKEWNPDNVFTEPDHTKEYDDLIFPKRATKGSAGYDFFAPFDFTLNPGETIKFPTGFRCKMKDNIVLKLYPRSGLGFKYRVRLENTVGVIDSDYYYSDNEGHIQVKLTNEGSKPMTVHKGEAYMQGIFSEYLLAVEDEVTKERNGGFGSTTK